MIAALLTFACLTLDPAMIPEPPAGDTVAFSGDAIPMIVNGEPVFPSANLKACTNYPGGCPAGTILLQGNGEPQGCDENCEGSCYACTGDSISVKLCATAWSVCITVSGTLPVSCGQKMRYALGCESIVAERGIPNLSPSCTCDTSHIGIPNGDCEVVPCVGI